MDQRSLSVPLELYEERRQRCRVEASARGFDGLIVFSRDPDRAGNGLYLANHRPIAGSHPSMYDQRGRGREGFERRLLVQPARIIDFARDALVAQCGDQLVPQ